MAISSWLLAASLALVCVKCHHAGLRDYLPHPRAGQRHPRRCPWCRPQIPAPDPRLPGTLQLVSSTAATMPMAWFTGPDASLAGTW